MLITQSVLQQIRSTVGTLAPETGGILACDSAGVVCAFYFDIGHHPNSIVYTPDLHAWLQVITDSWQPAGLRSCGMVHSHPVVSAPSPRDIFSCRQIMDLNDMDRFLLPIVCGTSIVCYWLRRFSDGTVRLDTDALSTLS